MVAATGNASAPQLLTPSAGADAGALDRPAVTVIEMSRAV